MTRSTYLLVVAALVVIVLTLSAVGKGRRGIARPDAGEFGPSARYSAQGLYVVSLQGARSLQPRKMYALQALVVEGKSGVAVPDATITVDGGMPEHGHGLPTHPRVTRNLGNGWYEVSGLRFNMGGWWEVKLVVSGPAGTDTVTFNLAV